MNGVQKDLSTSLPTTAIPHSQGEKRGLLGRKVESLQWVEGKIPTSLKSTVTRFQKLMGQFETATEVHTKVALLQEIGPAIAVLRRGIKKGKIQDGASALLRMIDLVTDESKTLLNELTMPGSETTLQFSQHVQQLFYWLQLIDPKIRRVYRHAMSEVLRASGEAQIKRVVQDVMKLSAEEFSKNMLILERALDSTTSSSLTADERKHVGEFLEFAVGNKKLNAMLRVKKTRTDAEEFLCALSYYTFETITCVKELERVQLALQKSGLGRVKEKCEQVIKLEEEIKRELEEFPEFKDALSLDDYMPMASQRLAPSRLQTLTSLREKGPFPQKLNEKIDKLLSSTKDLISVIQRYEHSVGDPRYIPPLTVGDARALERFADIHGLTKNVAFLQQIGNQRVREIFLDAEKAHESIEELQSFLSILPGYNPGDIIFDDEAMMKAYEGRGKKALSKLPKTLKNYFSVMQSRRKEGAWKVAPHFTGSKFHASIAISERGTPIRSELDLCFTSQPFEFKVGLLSSRYRPKFSGLLTESGKDALKQSGVSDPEEYIEREYAKALAKYIKDRKKELSGVASDAITAANAFLLARASHAPKPIEAAATFVFDTVLYGAVSGSRRIKDVFRHVPNSDKIKGRMFCSEFVAQVSTQVKKDVEKILQKRCKREDALFIEELLPHSIPSNAILSQRLEEIIQEKGYYEAVPPPLVYRILFH